MDQRGRPSRRLNAALDKLPGVGPTIASKLCARKRTALIPIFDSVVSDGIDAWTTQWEPLRAALRAERRTSCTAGLLELREMAQLSPEISAIRVYDVLTWMEGKSRKVQPSEPAEQLGAALAAGEERSGADVGPPLWALFVPFPL